MFSRSRVLVAAVLVVTACGSQTHPSALTAASGVRVPLPTARIPLPAQIPLPTSTTASVARTQCAAGGSAPTFPASQASSRRLALVNLKGSNDFIVRDVTDINHPFTVSNLGGQVGYASKFVSATQLATTVDGVGLIRMTLFGASRIVVARCGSYPFAWSPDGTVVAYVVENYSPTPWQLHIVSRGVDRSVDSFPGLWGVGCESRDCADRWEMSLLFSPDGRYISLVQINGSLRLWSSQGKLVKSFGSGATMQVWSGNTLFWRDASGVEAWRNGIQSLVLPGVEWIRPHASSAGGTIAFETRNPGGGTAHVILLDTVTGRTRQIATSRSEPAFLTSRFLWYEGEKPCTTGCWAATEPSGTTYLYDLQSGVEAQSIITGVLDVWPHAA